MGRFDDTGATVEQSTPELGGTGKPACEWLAIEGFAPLWFEGAQFKGSDGFLVRDPLSIDISSPYGWASSRNDEAIGAWLRDVYFPWRQDILLFLTKKNEEKALALEATGL